MAPRRKAAPDHGGDKTPTGPLAKAKGWRSVLPIHPAAAAFPRPTADEAKALALDIKAHGLLTPVVIWSADADAPPELLDGISRLDALEAAGVPLVDDGFVPRVQIGDRDCELLVEKDAVEIPDPWAYVESVNLKRRHLDTKGKRAWIGVLLKQDPKRTDFALAKRTGINDKTIASVRAELESRSEIPSVATRIDTKGRQQPSKQKHGKRAGNTAPASKPVAADPKPVGETTAAAAAAAAAAADRRAEHTVQADGRGNGQPGTAPAGDSTAAGWAKAAADAGAMPGFLDRRNEDHGAEPQTGAPPMPDAAAAAAAAAAAEHDGEVADPLDALDGPDMDRATTPRIVAIESLNRAIVDAIKDALTPPCPKDVKRRRRLDTWEKVALSPAEVRDIVAAIAERVAKFAAENPNYGITDEAPPAAGNGKAAEMAS